MIEKFNFEFLIPGRRKIAEKINEIIDSFECLKNTSSGLCECQDDIEERVDEIEHVLDCYSEKVDILEDKTILKPDYEPEDVALRCIAEKGTFEWALIQVKRGHKVKKKGKFTTFKKLQDFGFIKFPLEFVTKNDWVIADDN